MSTTLLLLLLIFPMVLAGVYLARRLPREDPTCWSCEQQDVVYALAVVLAVVLAYLVFAACQPAEPRQMTPMTRLGTTTSTLDFPSQISSSSSAPEPVFTP
jgi:hypothetical protein